MVNHSSKMNHLWPSMCIILAIQILMVGCENPNSFERMNTNDPQSNAFVPKVSESEGLEVSVIDLNQIRLQWPQIYEMDHYIVSRKSGDASGFKELYQTSDFRDTSFVDRVPESGDYYYQVKMVAKNGSSLTLESERTLSNFLAGPELQFDPETLRMSGGITFAMNLSQDEVLIHHYQPFRETPLFSKLNTELNEWTMTEFNNLVSGRDYVHGFDFFYAGQSKLLVVNRFFYDQDFLAYSCDIDSRNCVRVGEGLLEAGTQIRNPEFSLLNNGKVVVTVYTDRTYENKNLTFTFDPSTNNVEEVAAPLDGQLFTSMSRLEDGGVMGCSWNHNSDSIDCQISDEQFQRWQYVSSPLFDDEGYLGYGSASLVLSNGDIAFLFNEGEELRVRVYSYTEDTWSTLPATNYSSPFNTHNLFTNPLHQTSDDRLMIFHNSHQPEDRWDPQIAVELFSFDSMEWTDTYILPDYVEHVHNFVEIGTDVFLVTYSDGQYGIPRVAYLHAG